MPSRLLAGLLALGLLTPLPAAGGRPRASDFVRLKQGVRPAGKNFFVFHQCGKKLSARAAT